DVVLAGELHRADLQHLGTEAGHFQQLFEGDLLQALGTRHHARVGGVDAIDIGIDLALIGLQRRCQGHASGIGAATTKGGDIAVLVNALETGDDDDTTSIEVGTNLLVVDLQNARLGVGTVGEDANLVAGVGHRRHATLDQGHGQQGNGHLLAGGHHHIQFTRYRLAVGDLFGQIDQAVGFATHGGHHDDDVVALLAELLNLLGHLLDTLDGADGGAPKLLYDQSHFKKPPDSSRAPIKPASGHTAKARRTHCGPRFHATYEACSTSVAARARASSSLPAST